MHCIKLQATAVSSWRRAMARSWCWSCWIRWLNVCRK
uniref:Uncharacterized protein n=1 Tax=Picea sitchensis TaxID=3332 RepID=A9NSF3_PICSI|nr:unknown [Picea sitchensis]